MGDEGHAAADRDAIRALIRTCETSLAEGRRALDALADSLARLSAAVEGADLDIGTAEPLRDVLASHRDELVSLVVAALENGARPAAARDSYMRALVHRADDDSYRLGRRRVSLTDTEHQVLDLLWRAMPEPVSREGVLEALYPSGPKPAAGAIDVFISKLRQKLKLASGGTDFLESFRGKGWALKPELCRESKLGAREAGERRRA